MTLELEQRIARAPCYRSPPRQTHNFIVPGRFAYMTLHVPVQSFPQISGHGGCSPRNENVVACWKQHGDLRGR